MSQPRKTLQAMVQINRRSELGSESACAYSPLESYDTCDNALARSCQDLPTAFSLCCSITCHEPLSLPSPTVAREESMRQGEFNLTADQSTQIK